MIEFVKEFPKKTENTKVRLVLDGRDVVAYLANGECNTIGTFNEDGTLKLYWLNKPFSDIFKVSEGSRIKVI